MTEQLLFWVFAILSCGGALAVVVTQNVVRMAFWLVVSLGAVAALFFLLHADFLGAAQLLIYVGGTVVLLVFGVMLTASGHTIKVQTTPAETLLGCGVGLLLLCVLVFGINSVEWAEVAKAIPDAGDSAAVADQAEDARLASDVASAKTDESRQAAINAQDAAVARRQSGRTLRQLGLSFFGLRPDRNLNQELGKPLAPGYLLPFEIISIHLLVVLVGAAYLARAKRRATSGLEADL
ncbi:MAG: NADH-quinone oxidoreductase subunit J [Planctomycetaceae bacterium]